jgi:ABC-type transport system involved in cytochrome c biogenesis permease subunit
MTVLVYGALWLALALYAVNMARPAYWTGRAATGVVVLSLCALTVLLGQRGLTAGHWPLTTRYEFALCFVWSILGMYLIVEVTWHERVGGLYVMLVALLVATYALLRPLDEQVVRPLLPALRSGWLQVHVLSAVVGYGALGVAAGLAAMQLVRPALGGQPGPPSGESGEGAMERAVRLGLPWLTLSILAGAIWAQNAWGRYWGWDPKESWALVTWLWFLMVLHVPRGGVRGWDGRRLAWLVLAGFGIVCFAFAGLPWLVRTVRLESLHAF